MLLNSNNKPHANPGNHLEKEENDQRPRALVLDGENVPLNGRPRATLILDGKNFPLNCTATGTLVYNKDGTDQFLSIIVELKAKNNAATDSHASLQNNLYTDQDARTVSDSLSKMSIPSEQSQDTDTFNLRNVVNNPHHQQPGSRNYGISARTSVDDAQQDSFRREFHMGRDDQMSRNFPSKSSVAQYQDTPSLHNAVLNPQHQPYNVQTAQQENLKRKFQMNKGDQMAREQSQDTAKLHKRLVKTSYSGQDAPKLHNAPDNQPTNGARGRSHSDPAHRAPFIRNVQQYSPQPESRPSTGMVSDLPSNLSNQWSQSQGGFKLQNVTTFPNHQPLSVSGNYDTSAHQGLVIDHNAPQMRQDDRMFRQHAPCQQSNPISHQGQPSHGAYPKDTSRLDNVTPNPHCPPHYESWFHQTSGRKMFVNHNAQHGGTNPNSYTVKDDRRFVHVPQANQISNRGQQSHGAYLEKQDTLKSDNAMPNGYHKPSSTPRSDDPSAPGDGHLVSLPLNNVAWRNPPVPVAKKPIKRRRKVGRKLKNADISKPQGNIKSAMILGRTPTSSYPHLNRIIIPSLPVVRIRPLELEGSQTPNTSQAVPNPQAPIQIPTPTINLDDDPDVPGLYKKIGISTWICTFIKRGQVCNQKISGKRFRDRHVGTHANWEKAKIDAGHIKLEEAIAVPRLRTLVYECHVPDCLYFLEKGERYRYENYRVDTQKAAHIKKCHQSGKDNGSGVGNKEKKGEEK